MVFHSFHDFMQNASVLFPRHYVSMLCPYNLVCQPKLALEVIKQDIQKWTARKRVFILCALTFVLLYSIIIPQTFSVSQILSMGSRIAFCCLPRLHVIVFIFSKPCSTKMKTTQCCLFLQNCVQKVLYKAQFIGKWRVSENSTLQNFSKYYQLFHLQQESAQILEKEYWSE